MRLKTCSIRQVRARLRAERGFTLVELLIASLILTVVLGATLSLLDGANKAAPKEHERAHVMEESQAGLHRMARELRQAYELVSTGPWSIEARVYEQGVDKRIVYDCADQDPASLTRRRCVRWEVGAGGAQSGLTTVIQRVILTAPAGGGAPPPVFTYTSKGSAGVVYVRARLEIDAAGDLGANGHKHRIVLEDGFYLRNRDVS